MKKILNKLFALTIVSLSLVFFSTPFVGGKNVKASTEVAQAQTLLISKASASGETYYLYPNNNGVDSICNYFSYSSAGDYWQKKTDELYHYYKGRMNATDNSQFNSVIELSKQLIQAGKNGYLSVTASAYFASENGGKILFVSDDEDNIRMTLSANSTIEANRASVSCEYESFSYSSDPKTLTIDEFKGDSINLNFYEVNRKTCYEIMRVKMPTIIVKSQDVTSPSITISEDKQGYANKRILTITVEDSQSGIDNVSVDKGELIQSSISGDTKKAVYTFEVSKNDTYTFTVKDNIGNTNQKVYDEKLIDTQTPNLPFVVGMESLYYTKNITFEASYDISGPSEEYFVYTIDGTTPNEFSNVLNQGENSFSVDNIGNHVLKVLSFDEAGNYNEVQSFEFYVDDNYYSISIEASEGVNVESVIQNIRYNETKDVTFSIQDGYQFYRMYVDGSLVDVQNNTYSINVKSNKSVKIEARKIVDVWLNSGVYTHTGEQLKLDFASNINQPDLIQFEYFLNEESTSFTNVGVYKICWKIDTDLYIGQGELSAKISDLIKAVVELNTNVYTYSDGTITLDYKTNFDSSVEISFDYYTLNNESVSSFDVGEYYVVYNVLNDKYIGNGRLDFSIQKQTLNIEIQKDTFDYNGEKQAVVATNLKDVHMDIKYSQNGQESTPIDAGQYEYEISINHKNFEGKKTGVLTINRVGTSITIDNLQFEYNANPKDFKITVESKSNYTMTIKDCILDENVESIVDAGNYEIQIVVDDKNFYQEKTFIINVSKKDMSVNVDNVNIVYGESVPQFTYSVVGDIKTDNLTFELYSEIDGILQNNVGEYAILIQEIDSRNYNITYNHGTITISKKQINITISQNCFKIYGNEDSPIEFIYDESQIQYNDQINITVQREQGENVGVYEINNVSVDNDNYTVLYNSATYKISPRKIVVKAKNLVKVYAESDPKLEYEITYGNLVGQDGLQGDLIRVEGENVGKYSINIGTLNNDNYQILFLTGVLEIVKKDVSVFANSVSVVYGEVEQQLTYECEGLKDGDKLDGSLVREKGNNVGEYQILLGSLSSANYRLNFVGSKYVIAKKQLNISIKNAQKIYGEQDPVFDYDITGIVNGDDVQIELIREQGENVGEYAIKLSNINSLNYEPVVINGVLKIDKCVLQLKIKDCSKVYGEQDPIFELENNNYQELSPVFKRESGEDCGVYEISVESYNNSNYEVEFVCGKLNITKAELMLNPNSKETTYNGELQYIDEIECEFDLQIAYKIDGIDEKPLNAGIYDVVITFEGNNNYNKKTWNGVTLTINKKQIYISVENDYFVYDGTAKLPMYHIENNISTMVEMEQLNATQAGSYPYTIVVTDSNYEGQISGVMTIVEAPTFADSQGNTVSDAYGDLVKNNSYIQIVQTDDKNIIQNVNKSLENKHATTSYYLKTQGEFDENSTVVVSLNISDVEGLTIYSYNDKFQVKEVGYKIENGMVVFETSDLAMRFAIVRENSVLDLWTVVIIAGVIVGGLGISFVIVKIVKSANIRRIERRKQSNDIVQ